MGTVPVSSWSVPKQPPTKSAEESKSWHVSQWYVRVTVLGQNEAMNVLCFTSLKYAILNFKVSNLEMKPWHFPKLLSFDHQHSCTRSTGTLQNSRRLSSADSVRTFLLRSRWGLQRQSPLLPFPPWYSCSSETTLALWACGRTWKLSRTATF